LSIRVLSYCVLWIFPLRKSDGFGRERTRDLGFQRPARKPLDHRSCYLLEPSGPVMGLLYHFCTVMIRCTETFLITLYKIPLENTLYNVIAASYVTWLLLNSDTVETSFQQDSDWF
jgi:hypothetical protein